MPDSKKLPLEEEKERYTEFLNELNTIPWGYSVQNGSLLNILKDSILRFLRRFVSEDDAHEFKQKTRILFIISSETPLERAKRNASWHHQLYTSIKNYLESSLKMMDQALKTDYIREKSDAMRRGIVLDRKTKGSHIETIDGLRVENKRLNRENKQLREQS